MQTGLDVRSWYSDKRHCYTEAKVKRYPKRNKKETTMPATFSDKR